MLLCVAGRENRALVLAAALCSLLSLSLSVFSLSRSLSPPPREVGILEDVVSLRHASHRLVSLSLTLVLSPPSFALFLFSLSLSSPPPTA